MNKKIYITKKVAELLGVKASRIGRAIWDGRLSPPKEKPGRAFLWTRDDIERASQLFRGRGAGDIFNDDIENESVLQDERFLAVT